jgi:hypothetical protein
VKTLLVIILIILLSACKKEGVANLQETVAPIVIKTPVFISYNILKGTHYCTESTIKLFNGNHINFKVKFTSAAIYKTMEPENQGDVNKLYGFSEGIDNHLNSARIGWNWQNNALHLYAYTYAEGIRNCKEISTIAIGEAIPCSIAISANKYLFTVGEKKAELPRALNTATVAGYWQYPYFGGDEVAPHNICIEIMDTEE